MCGRFTLTASGEELAQAFGLDAAPQLEPRYNIAPTQPVAIVRLEDGRRRLAVVRWGLFPSPGGKPIGPLINARAETAPQRPAFRDAFARRRCLVPADGFYEWQGEGKQRQPVLFQLAGGRPFALAGLWDPEPPAEACTLLTTEPNALLQPIHDRMPVILPPELYARWLDPKLVRPADLRSLLGPFSPQAMTSRVVGRYVNDPRNEGPACVAPVTI